MNDFRFDFFSNSLGYEWRWRHITCCQTYLRLMANELVSEIDASTCDIKDSYVGDLEHREDFCISLHT